MAIAVFPEDLDLARPRPALRLVEFPVLAPPAPGRALPVESRPTHLRPRSQRIAGPTPLAGSHGRASAVVRRRRALLGLVVGALLVLLALPVGAIGGRALPSRTIALRSGTEYVVRPGDTLWSIALRLDPTGDPRTVVARLAAETGSDTIVPGEHLRLP